MFVAWWSADSRLGRKYSLVLFFFLCSIPMVILLFVGMEYLILLAALAKFSVAVTFILTYTYTLEIYDTAVRVTAVGTTGGLGRVGGVAFPFILIYSADYWISFPYYILFSLAFVAFIVDLLLPRETAGKNLDEIMESADVH
jgi:hypothetical protein